MKENNWYVFEEELPEVLDKCELYKLFKDYKKGNLEARNIIIEHNIRLVLYRITTKFENTNSDKEELVSVGFIGLIKAVDTYDLNKGYAFNTYAVRCIDNEIKMILRKDKKDTNLFSLNYLYNVDDSDQVELQELLEDNSNVIINLLENLEKNELYKALNDIINKFSERDKLIIYMAFGFNNFKMHTQEEIGKEFNVSRSYISNRINKLLKKIANELDNSSYIYKPKKFARSKK